MRYIHIVVLAVALQIPAAVHAQQVSVGGWVNGVDTANSTITIRTLANPRTVQVGPNAVIRVNGKVARLDQIPANSQVNITTERGPTGVLTATQINASSSGPQPSAAAPPGATVQGALVGMNIPNNTVTLRTTSGDHVFSLGSAPILVNGVRGSIRSFRLGQTIQIQRTLPTAASTDYIPQAVWVLPARYRVAGYQATTVRPAGRATARRYTTIRSRTRAYRKTYRSRKSSSRHWTRHARRRTRSRTRRLTMRSSAGTQAAAALAGTAPVGAATAVAPGIVYTTPAAAGVVTGAPAAVVNPGVVYVTPGAADLAVPPVTPVPAVPVTGGLTVAAPATIAPDSRQQSTGPAGPAATGIPDARFQTGVINGAVPTGVGNPRNQSIAPNPVVGPGVVAPQGVPDPRFQSFGPNAVPGVTVPAAPGVIPTPVAPSGFGRPGFVGPRVIIPPRVAPR